MRFGSVCSGIEAASVAWEPLGWKAAWYSEIESFPSAVLKHRWPGVVNLGDMTRFKEWKTDGAIDLLVGGTPCQSFSIAGLRKGLADPRGNLMLTYLAIAERFRPRWLVWENVPGVLSSGKGRDFGVFLGALGELGYGFAYRILDAQYFGVPQRRRRVFVVGYLGDWRRAAAVLFESASLRGDSPPSRTARKRITSDASPGAGGSREAGHDPVSKSLRGQPGSAHADDAQSYIPDIVPQAMSSKWSKGSSGPAGDEVANLVVSHSLRAAYNASEDGTGRGVPIIAQAVDLYNGKIDGDVAATLAGHGTATASGPSVLEPQAFYSNESRCDNIPPAGISPPLKIGSSGSGNPPAIAFSDQSHANGGGQVAVFDPNQVTSPKNWSKPTPELSHTLPAVANSPVAFAISTEGTGAEEVMPALTTPSPSGGGHPAAVAFAIQERAVFENPDSGPDGAGFRDDGAAFTMEARSVPRSVAAPLQGVRRLTPRECERLQGFPDDYTLVPHGKNHAKDFREWLEYLRLRFLGLTEQEARVLAADGPRYKALGNSMAVPVMRWIGERIALVDEILESKNEGGDHD